MNLKIHGKGCQKPKVHTFLDIKIKFESQKFLGFTDT